MPRRAACPKDLPRDAAAENVRQALFGVLVEGLADRFEPRLCEIYARLFAAILPGADLARYDRVRRPRTVAT